MGTRSPAAGCSWTAWRSRRNAASPWSSQLVAHLGQNMRFVLDASVEEFLALHAQCRGKETPPVEVLALANEITPEPVALGQSLNQLSGGPVPGADDRRHRPALRQPHCPHRRD